MKKIFEEEIAKIKEYAKKLYIPILRPESSDFLCNLVNEEKPKKMLEIGTAIGYSAILMLSSGLESSFLTTIEKDEERLALAKKNLEKLGLSDRVEFLFGDANEIVKNLSDEYDFIFLDGPKSHYIKQLPYLLEHLKVGGIILADNILFFGETLSDNYPKHKHRTAIFRLREFLDAVTNNKNLESKLYEIEEGLLFIKKLR